MELTRLEQRLRDREPGLMDATGRYAVLVPLVEGGRGECSLLYEVRIVADDAGDRLRLGMPVTVMVHEDAAGGRHEN